VRRAVLRGTLILRDELETGDLAGQREAETLWGSWKRSSNLVTTETRLRPPAITDADADLSTR
jgi:hypothetical protein